MRTIKLHHFVYLMLFAAIMSAATVSAQTAPKLTTPKEQFGFSVADDFQMVSYTQAEAFWKKLATESDRMKLVDIGNTAEGRHQWMVIISSPDNLKNLAHYKEISQKLARAEGVSEAEARNLSKEGKAIIWIDGGLHANETVGFQQLVETIYQLLSRTDDETMRFLHDEIILCVPANPDGSEMVANWYNRVPNPTDRQMDALPKLYNKYIGHDDNRDSYMSNMPETANMNRQMFIEWFPQIMYNHHQTGPAGAVVFVPPFRDPFNYNFDPLIPLGIEAVGTAMHTRLVEQGMGGSAMRSGSNYSTWWDGGLRTTAYFHNMIGILTEIIGGPNPQQIPLVPDKQLPQGDWPLPVVPQLWHYRQSVDYDVQLNRAILDYASRNRETLLFNIWQMGQNSIKRGSNDNWTITPKRIDALRAAMPAGRGGRGGGGFAGGDAPPTGDAAPPAGGGGGGRGGQGASVELYDKILHDPALKDPRGYIIPADQADFATATKFVNALIKNGIEVMRASSSFQVAGKTYPANSFVVKCAQAGRPFILDMFQPQDHPNDFQYPGGPPIPPYDIAGWTLAFQMGVQFDGIKEGFDGPFQKIPYGQLQPMPVAAVAGAARPAGYLISHQNNNSFILVNRLMKNHADVYWLKSAQQADGKDIGTGAIWVPASASVLPILQQGAKELGVPVLGLATAPTGDALKLKPTRIGLYDQFGGNMPSGWLRFELEQFEFPFEVVYPQTLDAGDLIKKFDVIIFTDGAFRGGAGGGRGGAGGGGGGGGRGGAANALPIPDEYKARQGRISAETTIPQIKKFLDAGGSIVTVGSSTSMAQLLGVPVTNALVEKSADGREVSIPREKFYIPGSLMRVTIDNTDPLAYGMPKTADVDFDSSPVFHITPSDSVKTTNVAWYAGKETLDSGWALGQAYLDGGTAVAEANVGQGKVFVIGPEVTFRGQPHGTFKLLFNGLFYGNATATTLPAH
jgi:Zinc carboxypeptidase